MISLFGGFILNVIEYLADKLDSYWNMKWYWRVSQVVELELKLRSYGKRKLFWTLKYKSCFVGKTEVESLAEVTADLLVW